MALTVPPTRTFKDVIGLTGGVNSYVDPQFVGDDEVRWAENAVNKGGLWQTRPGFDTIVSLAYDSSSGDFYNWWVANGQPTVYPQFFTVFRPTGGDPQFVFGVSGAVFYCRINSDQTIDQPRLITSINFDANVEQICATQAVQTASLQNGAYVVTTPTNLLMLQDGVSRAAFWDGDSGGHLNPLKKWTTDDFGSTVYIDGYNQTRMGKWMAWSANRLWVSNGNQVFASDLGDPLHFTEETVLVNIPSFTFPDEVTGLIDRGTSGIQQNLLFVGTKNGIFTIHSGVQNRGYWVITEDFVRKVFAGVSCVSHKSMITHMGLLYWYTDNGIVSFDSLGTITSTQSLVPIDSEMAYSKLQMGYDKASVCAGYFDTYLWWSVPVAVQTTNPQYKATHGGRIYNGHTQVMDRLVMPLDIKVSTTASLANSQWQGVWTGIRPVEWSTANIGNRVRTFCMSMDYDGVIRIWEGFNGNRADNNGSIKWTIETRAHAMTDSPFSQSVFRYFRLLLTQVYGKLEMKGYWKGLRGKYHELLDTSVYATPGSILLDNPNYLPIVNDTINESFSKQTRDILSKDNRAKELCTSAMVESPNQDDIDRAFSLLLKFEGIGALKAYRLAVDYNPDNTEGAVIPPETGQRVLPEASCPKYYPGASQAYTLVKRDSMEVLVPVVNQYIETGYVPQYPS